MCTKCSIKIQIFNFDFMVTLSSTVHTCISDLISFSFISFLKIKSKQQRLVDKVNLHSTQCSYLAIWFPVFKMNLFTFYV